VSPADTHLLKNKIVFCTPSNTDDGLFKFQPVGTILFDGDDIWFAFSIIPMPEFLENQLGFQCHTAFSIPGGG